MCSCFALSNPVSIGERSREGIARSKTPYLMARKRDLIASDLTFDTMAARSEKGSFLWLSHPPYDNQSRL